MELRLQVVGADRRKRENHSIARAGRFILAGLLAVALIGAAMPPQGQTGSLRSDLTGSGAAAGGYAVSGRIKGPSGKGLAGVAVSFEAVSGPGKAPLPQSTSAKGKWKQGGFTDGTTYSVTPLRAGYRFNPPSRQVSRQGKANFTSREIQLGMLQPGPGLNDGTDDGSAKQGKDAGFVETGAAGAPNDGGGLYLRVFNSSCNIGVSPGYLQFSLRGMPTGTIRRAVVRVFVSVAFNGAGWPWPVSPVLSLRRVTGSWDEMTVSSSNQPTFSPTILDSHTINTVGGSGAPFIEFQGWLEYDIASLYKIWVSSPATNHGLRFDIDNAFCANGDLLYIYSSDWADPILRPTLVLE